MAGPPHTQSTRKAQHAMPVTLRVRRSNNGAPSAVCRLPSACLCCIANIRGAIVSARMRRVPSKQRHCVHSRVSKLQETIFAMQHTLPALRSVAMGPSTFHRPPSTVCNTWRHWRRGAARRAVRRVYRRDVPCAPVAADCGQSGEQSSV